MTSTWPVGVRCRIHLLGPPNVLTPSGRLSATKPVVFGAALYLGLHRGRSIHRAELATLLWPDVDGPTRGERLRWLVRQLRQSGFPTPTRTPHLEIGATEVLLDVDELERATSLPAVLEHSPGDVMSGYAPELSDSFSRWLEGERDAQRSRVMRVLDHWLREARRAADWTAVEELARRVLAVDELNEPASLAQVEALVMQGRNDRAAQVLSRYRAELGLDTSTAVFRQVQAQVEELVATTTSAPPRSALVGRGDVLSRLLDCIDPSTPSSRRVVLAGTSGIGKSRVLDEFAVAARLRGSRVARLTCTRADALRPLSLVADLARRLLEIRGALGASQESIEVLRRFLGEREGTSGAPPEDRRAEVFRALRELIDALLDDGPVAVVADDVQWAERSSWAVLAPLIEERRGVSWIFGLRTETPEAAARTVRRLLGSDEDLEHHRETIWLAPLTRADVATLCSMRAAPRRLPPDVLALLLERAAGIPFVAEALVEHWLETGELSSLPPSVARLVAARLERLSRFATRVLEAVAVLGPDAEPGAVEAVSTLTRGELLEATRELESHGVLRTVDGTFIAHALWTESALVRIPASTLQLQHRYAAEWLEHLAALSALPDHRRHWAIALHWFEANDPGRARRSLEEATDVLVANGFFLEAAAMLERALDVAGATDAALHYGEQAADLYRLDESLDVLENVRRVHERYDEIARAIQGERYSPHHALEWALVALMGRRAVTSPEEEARLTACSLAPDASTLHRLTAAARLLHLYGLQPMDRARTIQVWRAVEGLHPGTARERLAFERCAADFYTNVLEDGARGLVHALRARDALGDAPVESSQDYVSTIQMLAHAHELDGDLEAAQATRRELLAWGERRRSTMAVTMALAGLVGTALEAGQVQEARALLPTFGRPPRHSRAIVDRARAICWIVCALEERDVSRAREELGEFSLDSDDEDREPGMPRARRLAIHAHLALLEEDDDAIRPLLPELLDCFSARIAYMDHPAYVAGLCLERLEGPASAARFIGNYLEQLRPERWPPREELRRLAASNGTAR